MSVQGGSGQFVAIVDLSGFAWSTCPPISMIKDSVGLLKKHYPYRLGGVFIVNGGATFNFLWSLVKPIMPKRALKKTFVLNKREEFTVLDDQIGSQYFEDSYGGERKENIVAEKYFKVGFWYKKDLTADQTTDDDDMRDLSKLPV
jgi:CRAL/TRIO domain